MPSNVYFISDTHFGHSKMMKYCGRPFASVEEMDEGLISKWNARVPPTGTVYHLGDFAFRNHEDYLRRLNGRIHLILGNHDHRKTIKRIRHLFASVDKYQKVKIEGQKIMLFHYSIRGCWDSAHWGSWHLYGHSHGNLPDPANITEMAGMDHHGDGGRPNLSFDVGVDSAHTNYTPLSFEEVKAMMLKRMEAWKEATGEEEYPWDKLKRKRSTR